jgi:hypothetical protein
VGLGKGQAVTYLARRYYEKTDVGTTAVGPSDFGIPDGEIAEAELLIISVYDQNCRLYLANANPSIHLGHKLLKDGDPFYLEGAGNVGDFQIKSETGTAKVAITLCR